MKAIKARKYSVGQKRYFYEDTEHMSQIHAGPGAYNPHD